MSVVRRALLILLVSFLGEAIVIGAVCVVGFVFYGDILHRDAAVIVGVMGIVVATVITVRKGKRITAEIFGPTDDAGEVDSEKRK